YLMLTTSQRNLLEYPWPKWSQWVDFLEVSIDEGHRNMELFDVLPEMARYDVVLSVQTVVRAQDQGDMARKTKICAKNGCKILLMPAVELDGACHDFPEFLEFEREVISLKKRYPTTVITPRAYFRRVHRKHGGCSPASIIVNSDGFLYYPCRTLERKAVNLVDTDLMTYLRSPVAQACRQEMRDCTRDCGWYQYFATPSFLNPRDFWDAFRPYAADFFRHH
ncbi:MAG TPA: hypothetical protein VLM37_06275, partial [Fibrobacteraceae bacterium]|nr:hypothetical protein [Fibrobacteraceae bacterium]